MSYQTSMPLVLEAMTLRGVGSYLHGARLEIKPLTVLCGANGSGKSIWLKALKVLEDSLNANRFPYGFATADWEPSDIRTTNAFYHMADSSEHERLNADETTEQFGVPGTIGLELRATRTFRLDEPFSHHDFSLVTAEKTSPFSAGWVPKGTRIRIRVAHPTHHNDSATTPCLVHLIELAVNDRHILRLVGERDPLQQFTAGSIRPRRTKPYSLYVSGAFWPGDTDADAPLARIGEIDTFTPFTVSDVAQGVTGPQIEYQLRHVFEKRLRQLLQAVLSGYFYIGAVRVPYTLATAAAPLADGEFQEGERHRYVGADGALAWRVEHIFGKSPMSSREDQDSFEPGDLLPFANKRMHLLNIIEHRQMGKRLFERLPDEHKSRFKAVIHKPSHTLLDDNELAVLAAGLNMLVGDSDLFDPKVWGEWRTVRKGLGGDVLKIYDEEIRHCLALRHSPQWNEKLARRLNFMLIRYAFENSDFPVFLQSGCQVTEYVSAWLNHLVNVSLCTRDLSSSDRKWNQWSITDKFVGRGADKPTHYMRQFSLLGIEDKDLTDETVARVCHPCLGDGIVGTLQNPRQLSAGFHQVFPIIVQLSVMRRGELLGVENPEVHLHPSLQLRLAGALMQHAASGRRIIVETHSDLVIRRVLRAVLSEEISQSQVGIYFTELKPLQKSEFEGLDITFHGTTLQPIGVDETGRITNWPKGFLDDDVEESQRLLEIMYGRQQEDDADEE